MKNMRLSPPACRGSGWRRSCAILVFALVLWGAGCSPSARDRPNVLLLTLDTTRADRLGSYGFDRPTSPFLDRLAAAGVRFEQARSQVPITLPSHASLFTGTYPSTHGSHLHSDPFQGGDLRTLAEILAQNGYQTAAFIAARVLDARFGLARGFDHYADDLGSRADGRPTDARRAEAVVADAKRWFTDREPGPFLAWVHFFDPHLPFDPPEPYRSQFKDDPYSGEIAYMDAQIGSLLDWLRQRGDLRNTIIIAIADHGESLGEHGIHGHTEFVYQEVLHIPFLMSWPEKITAGLVVPEIVRTIDVLPTILDLCRLDMPDQIEGKSLRPLLEGKPDPPRVSYFESRYLEGLFGWSPFSGVEQWPSKLIRAPHSEIFDLAQDPAESENLFGAETTTGQHLSHLLDDFHARLPATSSTASGKNQIDDATRRALTSLGYVSGGKRSGSTDSAAEDPKDHILSVRLFQQVMGGPSTRTVPTDLDTIRGLARLEPDQANIQQLLGDYLWHFEKFPAAATAFERSIELAPDDPALRLKLAALARKRGDTSGAQQHLSAAYELDASDPAVLFEMAEHEARAQNYSLAEQYYRRCIDNDPESVPALGHLAALLLFLGREAESIPLLEQSFALDRGDRQDRAFRRYLMGIAVWDSRQDAASAITYLTKATELNPGLPGPHRYLALIHAEQGRKAEATRHARQYLQLAPDGPDAEKMRTLAGP
ncbi:MAG: hypothetical protein DRQ89_14225 [Epsilonproteobacteria bacterium]|nr:MAG: hypothetical protein DRQ89_14225 [Campylobacterota bacterium]